MSIFRPGAKPNARVIQNGGLMLFRICAEVDSASITDGNGNPPAIVKAYIYNFTAPVSIDPAPGATAVSLYEPTPGAGVWEAPVIDFPVTSKGLFVVWYCDSTGAAFAIEAKVIEPVSAAANDCGT